MEVVSRLIQHIQPDLSEHFISVIADNVEKHLESSDVVRLMTIRRDFYRQDTANSLKCLHMLETSFAVSQKILSARLLTHTIMRLDENMLDKIEEMKKRHADAVVVLEKAYATLKSLSAEQLDVLQQCYQNTEKHLENIAYNLKLAEDIAKTMLDHQPHQRQEISDRFFSKFGTKTLSQK